MKMRFRAVSAALLTVLAVIPAAAQESATPPVAKEAEPAPLPDASVRRKELVHQLFGLQAAVETLPGTAFDMARNSPHEWGRTWSGLGKRYANQYGQFVISETIEFGVSALHHEDPRYFRLGPEAGMGKRVWHSIRSTWVARASDGDGSKIALGRIAGVYGANFIASRWSPESVQSARSILIWGTFGMATKSGANALREFWPDIRKLWQH